MAKVQVFLPEPPQEFNPESFRQINIAIESLQNSLNTNYQNELKTEQVQFEWFLS
jgi:transposase InsO family protein